MSTSIASNTTDTSYITKDLRFIVTDYRPDLETLIPHSKRVDYQGRPMLIVPNGRDEARLARNLGVNLPSPILTSYRWAGQTPWDIQRTTSAMLTESPRAYVLSTMGTGKTRCVLWAIDFLMQEAAAEGRRFKVLIAAPLSTLTPVWETETFRVLPHRKTRVAYGDRAKRRRVLAEDADITIINHHGIDMLKHDLVAANFDCIVIDEFAVYRNRSTVMWKSADFLVNRGRAGAPIPYAWGLTGSPTPNAPTDAWSQVRMLTPGRVPRSLTAFKDQTMRQMSAFKWIPRPNANDIVFAAMQPSVRFTREDVMELPETSFVDREVKLEGDAQRAYKMMFDKCRMLSTSGAITAVNEAVLQTKLLQVACGYIYTDAKVVHELPNAPRLNALEEIISETDRKVIVFVPYIHALQGIYAHLTKSGHVCEMVSGNTSRGNRDRIFREFQASGGARVLVAHPQCMAHGLTLTEANTIVWYSPTTSLEIYDQANARITRPGQTSKTLIAHLYATAVERLTYARLRQKSKMQGTLLQMFHSQELEF